MIAPLGDIPRLLPPAPLVDREYGVVPVFTSALAKHNTGFERSPEGYFSLSVKHFPLNIFPRTFPRQDNSPSLFYMV